MTLLNSGVDWELEVLTSAKKDSDCCEKLKLGDSIIELIGDWASNEIKIYYTKFVQLHLSGTELILDLLLEDIAASLLSLRRHHKRLTADIIRIQILDDFSSGSPIHSRACV